tara:strand:+ start:4808 stop:5458 length:651 start_codon:yes stop_codon:yes gene_type:complete
MPDFETDLDNHMGNLIDGYHQHDLHQGKILSEAFFDICNRFRGFNAPGFSLTENQVLLDKLLSFEKSVCSLDYLYFFYNYIARMYLQTGDIENAISYNQAALELNTQNNDREGMWAANMLFCDCALANDASSIAYDYFLRANPGAFSDANFIKAQSNGNEKTIRKLLQRKRRPSTFKYFETEEKKEKEQMVRLFIASQKISRATALKWYAQNQLIK